MTGDERNSSHDQRWRLQVYRDRRKHRKAARRRQREATRNQLARIRAASPPPPFPTRKERAAHRRFAETEPYEPGRYEPADIGSWTQSGYRLRDLIQRWFHVVAFHYPARLTLAIFFFLIVVITSLLLLPFATPADLSIGITDAFFTAVSAVCVTGLTVVDTATHWSLFGEIVILVGITLGGLGVMTMSSLLALVVSRRLGLTQKLLGQSDTMGRMGETKTLIVGVIVTTAVAEGFLFLMILPAFLYEGHSPGDATWSALFTAISTFNNAGFLNVPEGLQPYIGNWFVLLPLTLGAFLGAIGFPVISDLRNNWKSARSLSLHTKLTLSVFISVAFITAAMVVAIEWNNLATFGRLTFSEKILNGLLETMSPRSVGISAVDVSAMKGASWLITDISMFIGGGSGSHAGGIKVTTFAVLLLAVWAEARGRRDVQSFRRRIPHATVRQAVAVLLAGVTLVLSVTMILLIITPFTLDRVLFEVVSAFGTVGLSTGITPELPVVGKFLLAFLMITGRVGPMTLATALALKERRDFIRMPEERPIVG